MYACKCVYVCMYVCHTTYSCMQIFQYNVFIHVYVCMNSAIFISGQFIADSSMYKYVYICMYCMCVRQTVLLDLCCMYVFNSATSRPLVYVCMLICVYVYVCMYVQYVLHIYVCITSTIVHVCICMYVCGYLFSEMNFLST